MRTISLAPPHDVDAERSVLGSCLISRDAHDQAAALLRSEAYFYTETHRVIWQAMVALADRDMPIDLITMAAELKRVGQFESVGGPDYLVELTEMVPTAANVRHYAEVVRDQYERRVVSDACKQGLQAVETGSGFDARNVVMDVLQKLDRTADNARTAHVSRPLAELTKAIENGSPTGQQRLLATGIYAFDKKIGGLPREQLVYLCGRGGEGKTTFMEWLALNISRDDGPVLMVSMEVPMDVLAERFLAMEARVRSNTMRLGPPEALMTAMPSIIDGVTRMSRLPLWLCEHFSPTMAEIEAEVRKVERAERRPLACLILDRLELISCDVRDEVGRITALSRDVKQLQRKLKTTCVCAVQPNQDQKRREDSRPRLTDLGYSGRLRADAQMVCFMYRDDYEPRPGSTGDSAVFVLKNNHGPTGMVPLRFRSEFPLFESGVL